MEIKAIRKLPELEANQEWACEGGCDVIKPKYFENIFSQSTAHDGSSIKRQCEFFWTCQNNHLLKVWCTDKTDYILLPEDFYQAEAPNVVESNSIHESIDLLDQDIESIKNSFLKESLLTNGEADTLEQLIAKAMQLGEFYALRDAKAQAVPEAKQTTFITLTCAQLREAFLFGAPDEGDQEQLETEMTIVWSEDGHSGKGYYCYYSELPDEGAIFLDGMIETQEQDHEQ